MQRRDRFARVAAPPHANFIQAIALRVITYREGERQRVFNHDRVTADVSFAADAAELVDAGRPEEF